MPSSHVDPRNQINDLDSRRWLQFQKSWFFLSDATPAEFVAFFTKRFLPDNPAAGKRMATRTKRRRSCVGFFSENAEVFRPAVESLGRCAIELDDGVIHSVQPAKLDYAIVDLREIFTDEENYNRQGSRWLARLHAIVALMKLKSYLTIFLSNRETHDHYAPLAWEFGKRVGIFLTMKDEKIGCKIGGSRSHKSASQNTENSREWQSGAEAVYCLNFRRDSESTTELPALPAARRIAPTSLNNADQRAWFIVKPPPREKNVLLHPAKFPEPLIRQFIERFSKPGERVLDPMAGTGSALIAATACGREAYGIELNPDFCDIIRQRFEAKPAALNSRPIWKVSTGDASRAKTYSKLPPSFHYIVTSPPYWDMLRMKGAETQQKRQQAGLLQFYSDDARDVGNIVDYENFLARLVNIYRRVAALLEPGRHMTIIVKNVKKKGQIFPLAWDLSLRLSEDFALCREQFWCQDDQRLAPFGYRYAWVSNTFHHYCLHFQKPGNR